MRFVSYVSLLCSSCVARVSAMFVFPRAAVTSQTLTDDHLKIANTCRDVYCDKIESCETFVSTDTGAQATVALDGSQAVVCFRGSDSAADWWHNFKMCRVPFRSRMHKKAGLEVHSGFFISHNSIKAKIYAKLNAIIESGKCDSILFTGHSAGATLAAISAFDFQNLDNLPVKVVTFGSPKIGNDAFASEFNSKIKCARIVNDNDGIALTPLFSGYRHVGDLIRLRNVAPSESHQTLWDALRNFARLDSVADHDIDAYIATMEHWLKKDK